MNDTVMSIDIQGHRGCRGLMPENTLPAFLKALELNVTTLELDLAVSNDHQVFVSHEPYFRSAISLLPDGSEMPEGRDFDFNMYEMTYDSIRQYDVGSKPDPRYPHRENVKTHRPLLTEVIDLAKNYGVKNGTEIPFFNIEIKRSPSYDGRFHPDGETFATLVLEIVNTSGLKDKFIIQSFDFETLQIVRRRDPTIPLAMLIERASHYEDNIDSLGFKPEIYSSHFSLVNDDLLDYCRAHDIKVIPWTVNEHQDIRKMLEYGVDGIISDYPDRVMSIMAEK